MVAVLLWEPDDDCDCDCDLESALAAAEAEAEESALALAFEVDLESALAAAAAEASEEDPVLPLAAEVDVESAEVVVEAPEAFVDVDAWDFDCDCDVDLADESAFDPATPLVAVLLWEPDDELSATGDVSRVFSSVTSFSFSEDVIDFGDEVNDLKSELDFLDDLDNPKSPPRSISTTAFGEDSGRPKPFATLLFKTVKPITTILKIVK